MRSGEPTAAARAFVAAGRQPDDPANVARRPFVKICGVTDAAGALAAIRAGADAIGLNVVPGTPRELPLDEAAALAALVRGAAPAGQRPRIVAITADPSAEQVAAVVAAVDPDAIQDSGTGAGAGTARRMPPAGPPGRPSMSPRRPTPPSATGRSRARGPCCPAVSSASSSTPPAARIRAARASARMPPWPPRSPGTCRSPWPVA